MMKRIYKKPQISLIHMISERVLAASERGFAIHETYSPNPQLSKKSSIDVCEEEEEEISEPVWGEIIW